jgi:outer membrane protein
MPALRASAMEKDAMRRTRTITTLTAAAVAVAIAAPARAQQISEERIKELIKQAAERAQTPDPTTQPPAAATGEARPTVRLTLDDAVKFALDRNLDISVQRLNPEINDIAIASINSVYHPSLTSTIGPQNVTILPTNQTSVGAGGVIPTNKTLTFNGGVAQSIPWGGGSFTASLSNLRRESTINNSLFNPLFQSNWNFAYVQPLLRNFTIDSTRQQLKVTRINRDISDVQLRATITNTLSNVRNAYWDYVFAVQAVEVAQKSLDLASKLVQDNQTRVEIGTMAPIDVVQAQSEQATRRQALVTAQATKRTAELTLKRLIVAGTSDPNWNATIDPVDRPDFVPQAIDIEGAVRRALAERTDIEIARKTIQQNDVTLKLLVDQVKPQIDLQASYGLQGLGGTQFVRTSGVLGATPDRIVPGGIGDTFDSLFRNAYPTWSAQLVMSYPLGVSTQKANAARGRVQLSQVQAQLKQVELQVATDVTNAALTAQSAAEGVQAAQAASELAQKKLEAEQSKFEVGMSTNYFVVQAQRDLADAQNTELRAILNHRKSLVELERLQQTTLQNLNVTVINAGGGGATGTTGTTNRAGGQGGGGGQQ